LSNGVSLRGRKVHKKNDGNQGDIVEKRKK